MASSGPSPKWELNQDGFERLLAALDPQRDRAAAKYESVRGKLLRFFEWHGADFPEECADTCLNVVARRLSQGEVIGNMNGFCLGVARLVLLEHRRERLKVESIESGGGEPATSDVVNHDAERHMSALERCLETLPEASRDLILTYYRAEGDGLIAGRKALAGRLGLPLNALRIRAHRLRALLEECVKRALRDEPEMK